MQACCMKQGVVHEGSACHCGRGLLHAALRNHGLLLIDLRAEHSIVHVRVHILVVRIFHRPSEGRSAVDVSGLSRQIWVKFDSVH